MRWQKLGLVYAPDSSMGWAASHAYIPVPVLLDASTLRVYVTFWDDQKVGRIGFVDVSAENPTEVLGVSPAPVLDIGEAGAFDDSGVTASCILPIHGQDVLYYIGWQRGVRRPYFLHTGMACRVAESFERVSRSPVLDRRDGELFVRSAPFVLPWEGGYRMWYIAGDAWKEIGGKAVPTYDIRTMVSEDGFSWAGAGAVAVPRKPAELGLGRPWVVRDDDVFRMWYSIRTMENRYAMGYAESVDGVSWTRLDEQVGLVCSRDGWDSSMACFGAVVDVHDRRFMFYNGNEFGRTGFGVAVQEHAR